MSEPNPTATTRTNTGSRYLFVLLMGLVIGAVATVMAVRAIDARKDHFPDSVMTVQQWHLGQLGDNVKNNRCAATDTLPHLQALRVMANNAEPAFPDLRDDERFARHASKLRAEIDGALAAPPLNCQGVGAVATKIGESCKACHQDFRG